MDEEEILGGSVDESDSQEPVITDPPLSATEELIGQSPAEQLFREFELNQTGDPFRLAQTAAQRFAESTPNFTQATASGLQGVSSPAQGLFSHLAQRLINSAPLIGDRTRRQLGIEQDLEGFAPQSAAQLLSDRSSQQLSSGFIGRAGVPEYQRLLDMPGRFRGIFFQFQQENIVSGLVNRREPWELITQRLGYTVPEQENLTELDKQKLRKEYATTGQILAGNELTFEVGQLLARQRGVGTQQVYGVRSYASFHPKIGYVGDERQGLRAFIGTQNITPALAGNNSLESLMVFNRPGVNSPINSEIETAAGTESFIASEIQGMTDSITRLVGSQKDFTYLPGAIRNEMRSSQQRRGFLYVESEIYGRISGALQTAAFNRDSVANKDQVVISMGELSILLKTRGYAADLLQSLTKLAQEKRLVIVTDENRMRKFFDELRATKQSDPIKALGINEQFIRLLIDQGAIRSAPTGYQHDKTIAIFGGQDRQLQFINVGSANFSADSLVPVGQIKGKMGEEYFERNLDVLRRVHGDGRDGRYDSDSPINADTILAIGFGRYRDESRDEQITREVGVKRYLENLNSNNHIFKHYDALAGGQLMARFDSAGQELYRTGFIAERNADSQRVEQLRRALEQLSASLGGTIEIEGRYALNQSDQTTLAKMTGLKVRVKGVDEFGGRGVVLNLTVDQRGNVVIADTNKVITGSIFINKSEHGRTVSGRTVRSGESIQLSGIETAVGMVGTIARELSYQNRYGLVDTVFNRLLQSRTQDLVAATQDVLADAIAKIVPEIPAGLDTSEGRINLATLMHSLRSDVRFSPGLVLDETRLGLATGVLSPLKEFANDLTKQQQEKRAALLTHVFSTLTEPGLVNYHDQDVLGPDGKVVYSRSVAELVATQQLLTEIKNQPEVFNDLKLALVLATEEGRRQFSSAQQSQSSRLVSDLTAPFLAAHELGYTAAQAQARLPIYAESEIFSEATAYQRALSAGFLNPAGVKPGTRIGLPGQYFRPVGATSHARPLSLPGFGGLRQLSIVDSDISSGATIAYDNDLLMRSTSGLAKLTKTQYQAELTKLLIMSGVPADQTNELSDELEEEFKYDSIYLLPFAKAEQIPQRLKNVVGSRPTLDINKDFAEQVKSLRPIQNFDAGSVTSGRLREVLPAIHYESVQRVAQQFNGDWNRVEEYFREQELDPTNTMKGVIGPRAMKRVAMIGGISLIGDSNYLNAGYQQDIGDVHRMTVKIGSRNVSSQLETQQRVAQYLSRGALVISSATVLATDQQGALRALEEVRADMEARQLRSSDLAAVQKEFEQYDGGRYKNYLLKRESGEFKVYLKEGLYSPTGDRYERIGSFNRDGLIVVEGTGTFSETQWGRRRQPITLKFPAFGKRHQQGVSVVLTTPQINVSDSGTVSVTTDVMTMWQAGSGSRPSGAGLVKGPFTVIEEQLFDDIQRTLDTRLKGEEAGSYRKLQPQQVAHEKLYGLFGFGHFKGFNYESGIYLLSQRDSREAIQNLSGTEIARSLSLLFVGNKEVKQALRENLYNEGLSFAADAIAQVKGTDFGALDKQGKPIALGKVALGLTMLADGESVAGDIKRGSLESVRDTVIRALRGDTGAQTHLQQQANKLIQSTVSDPTSAIQFSDGHLVINEASTTARGAGLLAHMSYLGSQVFSPGKPANVGKLFERDLSNVDRYLNDVSHRNTVDTIAAVANLQLPDPTEENRTVLQRKLGLMQAMLKHDFVLEDIKDITVSKSLVPTGMKDEVALEYQYLLGMSSQYLKNFSSVGGGTIASREIQHAFAMLTGVHQLGLPNANAKVEYRLAFPGEDDGYFKQISLDTQRLLLGYTSLGHKMGLLSEAIKGVGSRVGTERGSLLKFINLQRIATGVAGRNEDALGARAAALNRLYGLTYFADHTDGAVGRAQGQRLIKDLHLGQSFTPADQPLSGFEVVNKLVVDAYENFVQDQKIRKQQGERFIGFGEFVSEGLAGNAVRTLEENYGVISKLTRGSGRIVGVPLTGDRAVLSDRIGARLAHLNEHSMAQLKESFNANADKEFVSGALAVEQHLQKQAMAGSLQAQEMLAEVQKTRQVVLPKLTTRQTGDGRYQVGVMDPKTYEPSVGVLMGTDLLSKVSLIFPQHTDEALRYQRELREQLVLTDELRGRIFNNPKATISEAEKAQLDNLDSLFEKSRLSLTRLLETDFVRKAMGDRQKYQGAVGIAVGSFGLDVDETVLGGRYQALVEGRQVLPVIRNQFSLLRRSLDEPSQVASVLSSTEKLVNALGVRPQEGVSSQLLSGLFSQQDLTSESVDRMERTVLSALAGLPEERVLALERDNPTELNKLIALNFGSIRRGGAPAGSSALTAEQNYSAVMDVTEYQQRIRKEGGGLIPQAERFKTGMVVPAVGRLLAALGDFDGDAYQFLLSGVGDHASRLAPLQEETVSLANRLARMETQFERRFNEDPEDAQSLADFSSLSEEISQTRELFYAKQSELNEEINKVSEFGYQYDRMQNRTLKDMRQWVGSYLALPDFITDEQSGVRTGQLMAMVQQMSGTMPQIEDGARHIQQTEQRLDLYRDYFNEGFDYGNLGSLDIGAAVGGLLPNAGETERDDLRFELRGILDQAVGQQVTSQEEFLGVAQSYLASKANLAMTVENINKSVKKGAGQLLNPLEFEGLQSVIGQAGTELIGKTYNSLIPLLDQAMGEHAVLTALNMSGERSFRTVMDENLQRLAAQAGGDRERSQIEQFRGKLLGDTADLQGQLRDRFSGLTGTLGVLQQLIRDALKAKEEGGILRLLQQSLVGDKTLVEAMESAKGDPVDQDRQRIELLKGVVNKKIGPDLAVRSDAPLSEAAERLRAGQALDPGLTGFGALIQLAEFNMSSDEELYTKFIEEKGLDAAYKRAISDRDSGIGNAEDFAARQVLDLVERSQASFIASTYSDSARGTLVNKLREFGQTSLTPGASRVNRDIHQLLGEYEAERSGGSDVESLDERLIQEVTLLQVQARNQDQKVLTLEHVKELRSIYQESQKIRFDDGDIFSRMQGGKIESYNALIRVLQRGQQPQMTDALYLKGFQMDTLNAALEEKGINTESLSPAEREKAAKMLGVGLSTGLVTPEEQKIFTQALGMGRDGLTGMDALQQSTAAMSQGVLGLIDEMNQINASDDPNADRIETLRDRLYGMMEDNNPNLDRIQRIVGSQSNEQMRQMVNNIETQLEQRTAQPFGRSETELSQRAQRRGTLLTPDSRLEAFGAMSVPLLMAMASSGAKFDERFGMFGLDVLQSVAQMSTDGERLSTKLGGGAAETAARNFSIARIKSNLENEGVLAGGIQSFLQEGIFQAGSRVAYSVIDRIAKRAPGGTTRVGQAAGTVAAEVLGTVIALSASRAVTKAKTADGDYIPDRFSDFLKSIGEQIWRAAEQAQLKMTQDEYEVVDTDENMEMDFETSAIPTELERDIETGMLVLDESNNEIAAEFDDSYQQQSMLIAGF